MGPLSYKSKFLNFYHSANKHAMRLFTQNFCRLEKNIMLKETDSALKRYIWCTGAKIVRHSAACQPYGSVM